MENSQILEQKLALAKRIFSECEEEQNALELGFKNELEKFLQSIISDKECYTVVKNAISAYKGTNEQTLNYAKSTYAKCLEARRLREEKAEADAQSKLNAFIQTNSGNPDCIEAANSSLTASMNWRSKYSTFVNSYNLCVAAKEKELATFLSSIRVNYNCYTQALNSISALKFVEQKLSTAKRIYLECFEKQKEEEEKAKLLQQQLDEFLASISGSKCYPKVQAALQNFIGSADDMLKFAGDVYKQCSGEMTEGSIGSYKNFTEGFFKANGNKGGDMVLESTVIRRR